jgi:probable HAF family extracellular repeat protein
VRNKSPQAQKEFTMARLFALALLVTSLFSVNVAWADRGYRVVPITTDSGSTDLFSLDVNNRGEVVGFSSASGRQHAFRWRDGVYTDLNDVLAPNAFSTGADAINDRSTIIGSIVTSFFESQAYTLRDGQVTQVAPVPGVDTFPSDINNRGQMIVLTNQGAGQTYFIDGGNVEQLPGLPGSGGMLGLALNERGAVVGHSIVDNQNRAVLWQNGTLTEIGLAPGADTSIAFDVNNRTQVIVNALAGGNSQAFLWQDGTFTKLPDVVPGQVGSTHAESLNDWGAIVGSSSVAGHDQTVGTLWLKNSAVSIDSLISEADPLKAFLSVVGGISINERGDILVNAVDSRTGESAQYLLTLF